MENNEHLAKHWKNIGNAIDMLCFLTVSTGKTKGMIAKNYQTIKNCDKKQ